jgi:hypothetical protein
MSLSKFYDKKYSNMQFLQNINLFGKKKQNQNTADLNDLLKETADDYELNEAGTIVEKNKISYSKSLHTNDL